MSKRSQMCSSSENVAEMSAPFLLATARMSALSMLMGAASESTNEIISLRTSSELLDIWLMGDISLSVTPTIVAPRSRENWMVLSASSL